MTNFRLWNFAKRKYGEKAIDDHSIFNFVTCHRGAGEYCGFMITLLLIPFGMKHGPWYDFNSDRDRYGWTCKLLGLRVYHRLGNRVAKIEPRIHTVEI